MKQDIVKTIDITTRDTNQKATKLCDDILYIWKKIQEGEAKDAALDERTKEVPDIIRRFYHMEKVLMTGNGSESVSKIVSDLNKAGLISRMRKVELDTAKNTALNNKIIVIAFLLAVALPIILDKLF